MLSVGWVLPCGFQWLHHGVGLLLITGDLFHPAVTWTRPPRTHAMALPLVVELVGQAVVSLLLSMLCWMVKCEPGDGFENS